MLLRLILDDGHDFYYCQYDAMLTLCTDQMPWPSLKWSL